MKKRKQGISLIVLIITIIVIIILAAAVILTLSKNNPIESAREAKFKENIRSFQDELSLTIANEYTNAGGQRDEKINASSYADIKNYIPSFSKEFEGKLIIQNDNLVYAEKVEEKEKVYLISLNVQKEKKEEYITDGLILYLDGIDNTRNGNNLNATKWEDLSGNNNDGMFVNQFGSIQYKDNGYEFTNNWDYIQTMNNIGLGGDPNFTIQVVYKSYGENNDAAGILWYGSPAMENKHYSLYNPNGTKLQFSILNEKIVSIGELDVNKKKNITVIKNSGPLSVDTTKFYEGTNKVDVQQMGWTDVNITDSPLQIGRAWQWRGNRSLGGIIYSIRVYNRVLSEYEIEYNYRLDKKRFEVE